MKLAPVTRRGDKGTPLTAAEYDANVTRFRDGINALMALWGVVFNPNGTLKDGTVGTDALADRAVNQPKIHWHGNFFAETVGANAYVATITPTDGFDLGDGESTSFVAPIRFDSANTGTSSLNVNGAGAKTLKKFGVQDLVAGDILAGQIYWVAYDGTNFQIIGQPIDRSDLSVIQKKVLVNAAVDLTTLIIPADSTIPQSSEGKEFITLGFTPKLSTSRLLVEFDAAIASGGENLITVALFKNAEVDAIAAAQLIALAMSPMRLVHEVVHNSIDPITFKIRYGSNAGATVWLNRNYWGATLGGLLKSTLTITEYIP